MTLELFKRKLLNVLFPIDCAGCGKEDVWLCGDCLLKLPLGRYENCLFCGKESRGGKTCPECASVHNLDGIFVCADYDDKIISDLIKKLKYSFARELGEVLGEIAGRFFEKAERPEFNLPSFTVIPVPLHKKRLNWRGFNQAEIIARYLAEKFGLPFSGYLLRIKYQKPQAKLGEAERKENIKGCFAWSGKNPCGKNILLIDDVATTGSTLDEAAGVLKTAGSKKVWGLVIAKG
jgi:competence protein ComFC